MMEKAHILLVNNYTARGGIPKAISFLANGMADRGHTVTIISQRPIPPFLYPFYKIGHKINCLSLPRGKRGPLPLGCEKLQAMYPLRDSIEIWPYSFTDKSLAIQKLREQIRKLNPDVCVCPLPDGAQLVWAVTLMGTGIPYVYSERVSPRSIENLFWTRKGRLAAMSGADAIHLLLPGYADSVPDFLKDRVRIIPNAIKTPELESLEKKDGEAHTLLWLGRLQEEVKQCCLAIDAFASLTGRFPDWNLRIAGDGPDRKMIEAHAAGMGLGNRVKFLGNVENVWPEYAVADVFCFSSRTEGMPNALMEAMASGLPSAAFRDCDGVADIIEDGRTGLLANEMTAGCLAEKLSILMGDASLRQEMGDNARLKMDAFSEKAIFDAWENLLLDMTAKKHDTVMDKFYAEPFASMARMSSRARQEYAGRDFGQPMPDSLTAIMGGWAARIKKTCSRVGGAFHNFSTSK